MPERTERERMLAGELYDASDAELTRMRRAARRLTGIYNASGPDDDRDSILRRLFGRMGTGVLIDPPFYCDYGSYIFLGDKVGMNFGCVILDCNEVHICDNVMFGPCVQIYAAYHPVRASERIKGPELSSPVRVGSGVWIGGGAIVLPGVTIGDNSTIGAGSVVTRNIPPNVVAAGNPARIIRDIEP
mgnify:FL=1